MAKGTSTSNKMMPRMETYGGQNNPGYQPPKGSAGASAFGEYTTKSNPMTVPKKGSQIGPGYGNSDRMKAMSAKDEQEKKESLRGQPC
ncbi:MAG: hypothetical protein ACH349_01485 [Candidatus Rhabdochlamydia sp.]